MSEQLINHSPDLKRLRDEGYELEIRGAHLIVHQIPYVTAQKQIKLGTFVTDLTFATSELAGKPRDHTILFSGELPCDNHGIPLTALVNSSRNQLIHGISIHYFFSSKPPEGNYPNYYEKIVTYSEALCAYAQKINDNVTAKTFRVILEKNESSVFHYPDTNASRADILELNGKFKAQRIAIIGLGGTGSYVLDFVAKTSVAEIQLFDDDVMQLHNVFRAPGAMPIAKLKEQPKKVLYFSEEYSQMHKFIKPNVVRITEANAHLLQNFSFVFICVDKNTARKVIMEALLKFRIPFVDVGLEVEKVDNQLIGMLRATCITPNKFDHIQKHIGTEDLNMVNDYTTNIQIAELNAFNAILAVMKWKKWSQFYRDDKQEYHTTFTLNTAQLLHDDYTA